MIYGQNINKETRDTFFQGKLYPDPICPPEITSYFSRYSVGLNNTSTI